MCCFLPCIVRRGGHQVASHDQEEAPVPVKLKSNAHESSAATSKAPSQRRRVSARQAHSQLLASLNQPANGKQTAALFRLRVAFSTTKEHLSPEFFAAVIGDLDTVLFGGCLSDRVSFDWKDMPATSRDMLRGVSLPHGVIGMSKVSIRLSIAMLAVDTKEDIWGTVVHEMVQAYLALTSGWSGVLMRHRGSAFEECCRAAVERLALEGLEVRHVV